jgi:hypothetical protein
LKVILTIQNVLSFLALSCIILGKTSWAWKRWNFPQFNLACKMRSFVSQMGVFIFVTLQGILSQGIAQMSIDQPHSALMCNVLMRNEFYCLMLTKAAIVRPPGSKMGISMGGIHFSIPVITIINVCLVGGRWVQNNNGEWLCSLQLSAFHALCDVQAIAALLYLFLIPLYGLEKYAPVHSSTNISQASQGNKGLRSVILRNVLACLCTKVIPTALNIGYLIRASQTKSFEDTLLDEIFDPATMCSFVISALVTTYLRGVGRKCQMKLNTGTS